MAFAVELNQWIPTKEGQIDLRDKLEPGNYVIKQRPMNGPLFFEKVESFDLPKKIYGDTVRTSERILSTYLSRSVSTGVLLSGEKGSGKTLLAKYVAATSGMPCILVNAAWSGDAFSQLLQEITQPCIVIFDEFEKTYSNDDGEQDAVLTLLDGVFNAKKLFILTCNDSYKINNHMKNRPGRIFYSIEFLGLTQEFILEYCKDRLKNQEYCEQVAAVAMLFEAFNFDMLSALIEEMNRYDEAPMDALKLLNVQPDAFGRYATYKITLFLNGKEVEVTHPSKGIYRGNPVLQGRGEFEVYYNKPNPNYKPPRRRQKKDEELEDYEDGKFFNEETSFTKKDIKGIDPKTGVYTLVNEEGITALLSKEVQTFSWCDAL